MCIASVVALVLFAAWLAFALVKVARGGKRVRIIEWNDGQSYVRFTPNPGIRTKNRHWERGK